MTSPEVTRAEVMHRKSRGPIMTSLDANVFQRFFGFSGIVGYVHGCSGSLGCFGGGGEALY